MPVAKAKARETDLLENLHGQLRGDSTARDELVKGVGESHADSLRVMAGDSQADRGGCKNEILTKSHGKTRSKQKP